jgi:hypothetical protein
MFTGEPPCAPFEVAEGVPDPQRSIVAGAADSSARVDTGLRPATRALLPAPRLTKEVDPRVRTGPIWWQLATSG